MGSDKWFRCSDNVLGNKSASLILSFHWCRNIFRHCKMTLKCRDNAPLMHYTFCSIMAKLFHSWRVNFFFPSIKVHMTWKFFSAYLKGLSKYRIMAFFFLKYLFSFQRYWCFSIMQIRSVMTSYCLQLKMVKYWIDNISRNIKAVFLKLGTINVHPKRNKMTPLMLLPWQLFRLQFLSVQKTIFPFTTPEVRQRVLLRTDTVFILS